MRKVLKENERKAYKQKVLSKKVDEKIAKLKEAKGW